jgi:hypothetical protein
MIHGDACFAYFNKIWGIPISVRLLGQWPKVRISLLGNLGRCDPTTGCLQGLTDDFAQSTTVSWFNHFKN